MITAICRICFLACMLLVASAGLAEAQTIVQQNPSLVIVKPNPVAAITGALLSPISQNPNQPAAQNNNPAPLAGPVPYQSANGSCQSGYVFDGHGYCIPSNSQNNLAPASNNTGPYGIQGCQSGYVPDGRGGCAVPYPEPNNAATITGNNPYAPTACMSGYIPDGRGACVPQNIPQNQNQQPVPPPPAAAATPAPAPDDTSGACPAGYALDHDGNCSFASETNSK